MAKKPKPAIAPEKNIHVSFSCPVAIQEEIKRLAIEQDRNLTKQIVRILRLWLLSKGLLPTEAESHQTDD